MKNEKQQKKSIFKQKLENIKHIVSSKQFKDASKELIKSVKEARDSMDVFK